MISGELSDYLGANWLESNLALQPKGGRTPLVGRARLRQPFVSGMRLRGTKSNRLTWRIQRPRRWNPSTVPSALVGVTPHDPGVETDFFLGGLILHLRIEEQGFPGFGLIQCLRKCGR